MDGWIDGYLGLLFCIAKIFQRTAPARMTENSYFRSGYQWNKTMTKVDNGSWEEGRTKVVKNDRGWSHLGIWVDYISRVMIGWSQYLKFTLRYYTRSRITIPNSTAIPFHRVRKLLVQCLEQC